jgi:ATP-dependent Clp protease ATP-binding subunit ClpC
MNRPADRTPAAKEATVRQHLSKRSERVLALADEIAREYEQDYVDTEQVLLAIVREGTGRAVQILAELGLDEHKVRAEIDRLIKKSMEDSWVLGRLPGSPHFKNVIANAVEEASAFKAAEVCTEHLLLALLREDGCVAQRALKRLGVVLEDVREKVTADGD